jgi:superfamily II DNA or RNA helicase
MLRNRSSWKALSLWPNQQDAIATCELYLSRKAVGDALVHMPTGTGKTGVIAVLASEHSRDGVVVVLSPSSALADQLRLDISVGFWEAIKLPANELPAWAPESVTSLLPSLAADLVDLIEATDGGRRVLVGTLQALQQIRREKKFLYELLKTKCSLLIVDEGHREPAPEWAEAVRVLERPTVLFTATPYRNDQKLFDIAEDKYIYYLSFDKAVAGKLIRPVKFQEEPLPEGMDEFATELVARVDDLQKKRLIREDAKVIVRCSSESSVSGVASAIKTALGARAEGVLAIHDQFDGTLEGQVKRVPNIRKTQEIFLVHQFKLMEGIDEPRCSVLAIFEDFSNDRQLVQQIGRILRHENPRKSEGMPAVVAACHPNNVKQAWERYKAFDRVCEKKGQPPIRRSSNIISKIQEAFPEAEYVDRRFRRRVDFSDSNLWRELLIPKSCIVYTVSGKIDTPALMEDIRFLLGTDDRFIVSDEWHPNLRCHYILSIEFKQTPLLATSTFSEPRLTATVLKRVGKHLFFHDTAGLWIDAVLHGAGRIDAQSLRCLFPDYKKTRVNSLSVKNSEIGNYSLLSRTLTASSLADSAPFMGDYSNFITRAAGVARLNDDSTSRRYVGFTRARIRDSAY